MKISELCAAAFESAKKRGWHDKERSSLEHHMLIVSEIAEATEEARKGSEPVYALREGYNGATILETPDTAIGWRDEWKPEGELIELADAVIRIADYCGSRGWDLEAAVEMKMKYNETRPYRHGGKKY